MRPLWRETSTRHQNAGLKNEPHRPHFRMPVWEPNVALRTSVRPPQLAASFIFHRVRPAVCPKRNGPSRGQAEAVKSELLNRTAPWVLACFDPQWPNLNFAVA
jgi:hypothetical protein